MVLITIQPLNSRNIVNASFASHLKVQLTPSSCGLIAIIHVYFGMLDVWSLAHDVNKVFDRWDFQGKQGI